MWYIMRAIHITANAIATLAGIIKAEPNIVVYVVKTATGKQKFVTSHGGFDSYLPGNSSKWTIDTGMGHRNAPWDQTQLFIENVIEIVDGKIARKHNDIGLTGSRSTYVFK